MATATAGVIVGKVMFLITCDVQRVSVKRRPMERPGTEEASSLL